MSNSGSHSRHEVWQTILTALLVVVGAVYTIAAIFQWRAMKEQSETTAQQLDTMKKEIDANRASRSADFIFRFDDGIYRSSLSQIRIAIESGKPILKEDGGKFTADDLERYLDIYETMHDVFKEGLMSENMIDSAYGHVLEKAYHNAEIQMYLAKIRKQDPDFYSGFEELAKLIIARNPR